jgi:hypothetical protein
MARESNSVNGFWTGYLVHGNLAAQVNVGISEGKGSLRGSFDVPTSADDPKKQQHGEFSGRRFGHSIYIKLSQYDRHGDLEFHVSLVNEKQRKMIHGVVPLPGVTIPFATVTLFPSRSPARSLAGAWPFFEKNRRAPKV